MCLAVPGKLIERTGNEGLLDVRGNRVRARLDVVPEAKIGDYVLLHAAADTPIDPALVLQPDPRGRPQSGERVTLYSGLGGEYVFSGTVQSASLQAVWVVMDGPIEPSGMSGSPFLSQHTGQVVGMAIAMTQRSGRVLLGAHPIGSLVRLAEAATEFPKIAK